MNKKTKEQYVPKGLPKDGMLDTKTAEVASALVKAFINKEVMGDLHRTIQQVEAMKAAPPKGVPEK